MPADRRVPPMTRGDIVAALVIAAISIALVTGLHRLITPTGTMAVPALGDPPHEPVP